MKAVLVSIKPEWCELIMNGKKAAELRKSAPADKGPFKAYIYCSKNGKQLYQNGHLLNGKVIGEFVCPGAINFGRVSDLSPIVMYRLKTLSCVDINQIIEYSEPKNLHVWPISDYFSFTTPKGLDEFLVSRAPMSWQYVEDQDNE